MKDIAKFKTLPDLFDYFKDQQICIEYLELQRWNGKPVCPHCGHEKAYKTTRGYKCASPKCYKKFTVLVGTFMESTKLPLRLWFAAMFLAITNRKGISSVQLADQLQIEQKTAWFLLHRIREMLREKKRHVLEGEVEIDETFMGGKETNKPRSKRVGKAGYVVTLKQPVVGLLQRGGNLQCYPVPDVKANTLLPIVNSLVKPRSTIYTDSYEGYRTVRANYTHESVNHSVEEFVRGNVHTQGIEGAWSHFKRFIYGTHHQVSNKHLGKYCNEFTFRYNTRNLISQEKFELALQQSTGRLLYKNLVAKVK